MLGKKAAIITLIIDIAKGVIAVFVGRVAGYLYAGSAIETMRMTAKLQDIGVEFNEELELAITSSWMTSLAMACGLFAFIGHIWPLIFKFKGGKGVATAFGVLVALNPLLGIFTLLVVALVVAVSGMVSLGSVCGAISLPIIAYFIMPEFVIMGCIMAIIVIIKHRQNIGRIIKGEESKLFHKK